MSPSSQERMFKPQYAAELFSIAQRRLDDCSIPAEGDAGAGYTQ